MKLLYYIICITFATAARAQQDTSLSRWQIGINLQPSVSYRLHTGTKDIGYFSNDRYEKAYDIGLNVSYDVSKHIDLETGFHYGKFGYGRLTQYYAHSPNVPMYLDETFFWNYASVPVLVTFHSSWKKFNIIGGIGLAPGFMVSKGGEGIASYNNGDQHTQAYENVNKYDKRVNLFALGNLGIKYRFGRRMTLRAELSSQVGTLKIRHSNYSVFNLYLWNVGVNVGCYVRLG